EKSDDNKVAVALTAKSNDQTVLTRAKAVVKLARTAPRRRTGRRGRPVPRGAPVRGAAERTRAAGAASDRARTGGEHVAVFAEEVNLAGYTTLRLGGPARRFVEATTEAELVGAVRRADEEGEPVLVLGGGSNLVVSDDGFPGTVVHVGTRGTERVAAENDTVLVRVQAGEDWDPFVARCVADGLSGVECLSGIPGRVGATPIQNVGAYGQDVSETIVEVRAYDRETRTVVALGPDDCR